MKENERTHITLERVKLKLILTSVCTRIIRHAGPLKFFTEFRIEMESGGAHGILGMVSILNVVKR